MQRYRPGKWDSMRSILDQHYWNMLPESRRVLFGDRDYYPRLKRRLSKLFGELYLA
jgi:hypothetical protein